MKQILIIEDDERFRDGVAHLLRSNGFQAVCVASGEEGLRAARLAPPDLILVDLYLGDSSGYSLLRSLAQVPSTASIPVIVMTGYGDHAEVRRGMQLGADDFLLKPFDESTLLESVRARLRRQGCLGRQAAQTAARLVAILEATPDLVGILDPSYSRLTYLNQAGRKLLDIGADTDLATLDAARIHPPHALEQFRKEALPIALASGMWSGQTLFQDGQRNPIPFSQVVLAQTASDGRLECWATIARDVSAEHKAKKEHDLLEVQLRQAQKLESIGQLAAGIAHEINTPTQYVGDNLRFLQTAFQDIARLLANYDHLLGASGQGQPDASLHDRAVEAKQDADLEYMSSEIPKAIAQSLEGVGRVAKIVQAMKEFSHPGARQKTLTDLNHAIESTLTVARNEWKYVAELETDFDARLPLVPCLPGEMNQVILNLVVNAAHAIADVVGDGGQGKGLIRVTTRLEAPWAEIRIADTGAGIPERIRDKIFDPFFTTKPVGKGTGQGLAIARSVITDKHGGTIHFETQAGRGTTFVIRLPIQERKNEKR